MKKSNVLNGEAESTAVKTKLDKAPDLLDCLDLNGYYGSSDIRQRANWLKEKGDKVCEDTLKQAVLKDHKVMGTLSNLRGKYVITWGKLKPIIGPYKYERYLNIEHNEEKIIGVKEVENYIPDDDDGCYYRFSAALINILAKEYSKDENSEFQFSFADLDQKGNNSVQTVVVIQVVRNPDGENPTSENPYYDYSTDPKKKEIQTDNIPL